MKLAAGDGDASRWNRAGQMGWAWTDVLPDGTTQVDLYSWSKVGFWDCVLFGFDGWPVSSGSVRRVASVPEPVPVPPQNLVNVTVDPATYPHANRIVIVLPQDHQPDPGAPSGHATGSTATLAASLSYGPLDLVGGSLTTQLLTVKEDGYVQLWEYDSSATTPGTLAAWQQLPPGSGGLTTHSVTF